MSLDPDAKFERALLETARGDAMPGDVPGAWARFADTLGSASLRAAAGGDTPSDRTPRVAVSAGGGGTRAAALKWLLLGALGGMVPTAALVLARRSTVTVGLQGAVAGSAAVREGEPSAIPSVSPPAAAPLAQTSGMTRPPETAPAGRHGVATAAAASLCRSSPSRRLETNLPRSTLAAEVSRVETARTAIALGDYDQAVRLVDGYHRDFPNGALGPDADVIALDAVAARRDQREVARRAALFLARYPNDPHAARVKALVATPPKP
jgi:hypothetical protein